MTFRCTLPTLFASVLTASLVLPGCSGGLPAPSPNTAAPADFQQLRHVEALDASEQVNWPQPGLDAAHTAFNTLENTLGTGNVSGLTQLWQFSTSAQVSNPVVVANGVAYVDSADGYLYAVTVSTGAMLWKYETYVGNNFASDPVVSGGKAFVECEVSGSNQKQGLCAINAKTGKKVWSYYIDCNCLPPGSLQTSPVVSGSTIVFGYNGSNGTGNLLTALDTDSGAVIWQDGIAGSNVFNNATPAVANGTIYVGGGVNGGASLCSFSLASGSENWCTATGDSNNPAVSGGKVFVNTLSHGVFAFNASTGSQIWHYTPTAGNYGGYDDAPAIANGKVYVSGVGSNGNLYALNASTGALIFNTSAAGSTAYTGSSPSIAHNVAYVVCYSGLCAFNATTGATLFEGPGNTASQQTSPAVVNGTVYVGCGSNNVCAWGL